MYITNSPIVADIASKAGVDRIFIDLEVLGKQERQGGMDTVQSRHSLDDILKIKDVVVHSTELLVRSNPIHANSKQEIDTIIRNGADVVMLPYFKTVEEVTKFVDIINGRAKVNLLLETPEAVDKLDEILDLNGIDEIHVGLNDLHLGYKMKFLFQVLTEGIVDKIGEKVLKAGIKFGFGGIASLGKGIVPAEMIIKEHYRIGSTCAILSRAFCNTELVTDPKEIEKIFINGLREIRAFETEVESASKVDKDYYEKNRRELVKAVNEFIESKK